MRDAKEPFFGLSFWVQAIVASVCGFELAMLLFAIGRRLPAGGERFWFGEHAPVRDLLEVAYFLGNLVLAAVGAIALLFARGQVSEAKVTRLATLYGAIEERWSSPEMVDSRAKAAAIIFAHGRAGSREPIAQFADAYLRKLAIDDFKAYTQTMGVLDLLEFVGLMHKKQLIDIEAIGPLLGGVTLNLNAVFCQHIASIDQLNKARADRAGLRLPDDYQYFNDLVDGFQTLYTR